MREFIKTYQQKGLLKAEKIGFDQIIKHFERAQKDLKVAKANFIIDSEASYNYAYLAMLRAGRGLMFSYGFRPTDGEQHKTVVAFSEYILGRDFPELVRRFNRMRKKRNCFTYEEPGFLVTETETHKAFEDATKFVEKVLKFVQVKNPQQKLI